MQIKDITYLSYCGYTCNDCPKFIENQESSSSNSSKIIKHNKNSQIRKSEHYCSGCKSEDGYRFFTDCNIAICARNRGVEFCGFCDKFPCELYSNFDVKSIQRIFEIKSSLLFKD